MFKISESSDNESLEIKRITSIETESKDVVKSLAATFIDGRFLIAVGYTNGIIELYDVTRENIQMTQRLKCHKEPVNFLVFSPTPSTAMDTDHDKATTPIILASISEEICFWNVTHALNNPMERGNQLRLSQRINRKPNPNKFDTQVIHTNGNGTDDNVSKLQTANTFGNRLHVEQLFNANLNNERNVHNPWIGKTGTSEKPELLACIKFVGSSAEKLYANHAFDTFITVDNEGVIYFLKANNELNEEM